MQAFYALATEDYRQLARARDWATDLREHAVAGRVRLLDVACGSGKFPAALMAAGLPTEPAVHVDLLDPSAFSIAEARRVLAAPFVAADEHEVVIQDFDRLDAYDVAWATHALYALAPDELAAGIARMTAALRPGGFGVVALAGSRSHYLAFYEAYRPAFAPDVTPYTDAEGAAAALRSAGADVDVQLLPTAPPHQTAPSSKDSCSAAHSTTACRWSRWRPGSRSRAICRLPDGGRLLRVPPRDPPHHLGAADEALTCRARRAIGLRGRRRADTPRPARPARAASISAHRPSPRSRGHPTSRSPVTHSPSAPPPIDTVMAVGQWRSPPSF